MPQSNMPRVLSSGRKEQPAGYGNRIRSYPQFMLLAVREGDLHVEEGASREILRPTRFLVLTPGVDVDLSSPRTGYRGFYVEGVPAECSLRRGVHRIEPDGELRRLCGAIDDELSTSLGDGLAALLLHELFLRVLRRIGSEPDPVVLVERLLEHHRHGVQRLGDLLEGLPWSRRQLERRFLAATGETIKQRHLSMRLEEARRVLATGAAVTEVAHDLGFPSSQHFATVFRRHFAMTPSVWRESVR